MIETVINIAKMVLAILPFVILCFAGRKNNLPSPERSKQFAMPVIALVYVVALMLTLDWINTGLITFINNIPKWISQLAVFSWMPGKIASVIESASKFVESVLKSLNLNFWIFFISNTVMIIVYLIIKKICLKIIRKNVKSDGEFHTKIAENFYEYFPEKDKWCLKENFVNVRSMFKVFYYSSIVLSATLMIVSREFYYNGLFESVFYPVFGILIVGELYFYLHGTTKREYSGHILGEDEDAYKTINYSLLRKFLRSIFGDKLLTENTSINNTLAYDVTTDEIIRDLESSEDTKVECFASYINALNKTGFQLDHNYLKSSLDMLNGKSILFNNPFYNDLVPYAFYPMNRTILSHRKVLVVLGRHSIENDITEWLERGISAITNIPFMWNIGILNSEVQDLDIGIVTRSDVLNIELHNANADFLEKVGFVVIIEPSKLISTAQIGLNLLVKKCKTDEDKEIVYCLCDKNCDGLVDAMSHVLMTSITEVSATKKHLGTSSYMCWETDGEYLHHRLVPNISRYLGIGMELSLAALKNQVSKTKWYGGETFPVTDIRWIGKQYYYELTKYANLPTTPDSIDECFSATPNFWSAEVEKNNYLTVEDESFNMFEILRDFSTRTTEQGFINVISSDYLLKDYMADNASIFEADAKAIPYIVADYTRSNRNTILRLILMMSTFPVSSEILEKELSLLGITVIDIRKQLWYEMYNCYAPISETEKYSCDYRRAVSQVCALSLKIGDMEWTNDLIERKETFNVKKGKPETTYSISDSTFLRTCVAELRSAGYVAEDEKGQRYYLGAELNGHIYQKYLPGQFFTFDGKYYEMQYLTADGQVLVRRAADHITGRPVYRQIREYTICGTRPSEKIGAKQNVSGMKVVKEFADICVSTPGYYRMERYNDFTTAKKVCFEGENSGIPKRIYRNKEILRIELPDFNGKMNDNIRYTITVLFNEVFKTLFAENQAYIRALTDESFLADTVGDKPLTDSLKGDGVELLNNAIYIVEDSQLDLGLTVAVERNIQRIFEIINDYLDWHIEALEESLNPPVDTLPPIIFDNTTDDNSEKKSEKKKKQGIFSKIGRGIKKFVDKIKGLFKRKLKKGKEPIDEAPPAEAESITEEVSEATPTQPASESENTPNDTPEPDNNGKSKKKKKEKSEKKRKSIFDLFKRKKKTPEETQESSSENDVSPTEETPEETTQDIFEESATEATEEPTEEPQRENTENEVVEKEPVEAVEGPAFDEISYSTENDRVVKQGFSTERLPYHERYYMLYGKDCEPAFIDLAGTLNYLSEMMEMQNNSLKQARNGKRIAELVEASFKPGKPDSRYCDFCGTEIFGVEYETLADGRDRCLRCGKTAIKTGDEFRKIFEDVKRNMESFFGIKMNVGIKVEMVNSKTLHKRLGKAFIPTPKSDGRVLGVAINDKQGYTLLVENGSPRMASMLTMAHELTHIWQYVNWNDKAIRKKYGRKLNLQIYEGMAKWVEIQYAYLINEPATAKREEIITFYREDEYGYGFMRYRANYPFSVGTVITKATPFMNVETPLDLEYCGSFTVVAPTVGINAGDIENGGKSPQTTEPIKGAIERNPQKVAMYAYNLLDDSEKAIYDLVLNAINDFVGEVNDFSSSVTDTQIKKIVDYVQRDHPELFWFRHGATFCFDADTHILHKLELTYCMTREEAENRRQKIETAVNSFLTAVDNRMSDYEVTLRIYENMIKLVDYDTIGLENEKESEASCDIPDDLRSIYGVFVNKKAVCAGYAKAFQYLLNKCGIECTYVTSDTHAWNLIKLEGDYYHIDVTWGDGSDTKKSKNRTDAVTYDCFCITTEELARLDSHIPESTFPLPLCTATKCNYHRRQGLYFEKYDFDRVKNILCQSVKQGKLDISIKFATADILADTEKHLIKQGAFIEAIRFASLKSNVKLDSSYKYSTATDRLTMAFYISKL